MSKPLEEAPDDLPGDDLDNVLDENGAVIGRVDDAPNAPMPTLPEPTQMSPERGAHVRITRQVDSAVVVGSSAARDRIKSFNVPSPFRSEGKQNIDASETA